MRRLVLALVFSAAACGGDPANDDRAFSEPVTISDPSVNAFLPTIASHGGDALLAWHQFESGVAKLRYVMISDGVPGSIEGIAAVVSTAGQLRPSVAATESGYVLAWQERDGGIDVGKAAWLDEAGTLVSGPEIVSSSGAGVYSMRVAAAGENTAFAWTGGSEHHVALRGPGETLAAMPVGTTLISQTVLNFPRIALTEDGTLFVSWRDGGIDALDWDVLLTSRARSGAFGATENVSSSPDLLSDDISLALDGDTLRLAWVDQHVDGLAFDTFSATRNAGGTLSEPERFTAESQDDWAWLPSITPRGACVWSLGQSPTNGVLWFADGAAPFALFDGLERGGNPVLAGDADHLAYVAATSPGTIVYSRRE